MLGIFVIVFLGHDKAYAISPMNVVSNVSSS